ncbi:hypothetical protein GCM10027417_24810 [Glutamicibacter endophyticus]
MAKTVYDDMAPADIRNQARSLAAEVLQAEWDGTLPVDPISMATSMGIQVFTAQLGNDVYGLIQGSPRETKIYLDVDQSQERMRFTCAHELGHFVERTGRLVEDEAEYAEIDKRSDDGAGKGVEVFANEFAAAILMPEEIVRRWHADGISRFEMAKRFRVSAMAMGWRLTHLRLA